MISIDKFADGVVKNNKDCGRKALIASLQEALNAKKWVKMRNLWSADLGCGQRCYRNVHVLPLHDR